VRNIRSNLHCYNDRILAIRLEEGVQDWLAMGLSISVGEEKTPVKEDLNL
jgi:hypothetical protein